MITNGKKHHYLPVTNLSLLLEKISSNHDGDVYCLNCFSSYTTKNKLKDSCRIDVPSWAEKTLKYNPGEKSLKAPDVIYIGLECVLKKKTILPKQYRKILYRKNS